ncbi:hypothetical protein BZ167_07095 [Bacillus sp. 275]|nr:hypothetical protein BZ167_07095 [Bacillus sp. 275]
MSIYCKVEGVLKIIKKSLETFKTKTTLSIIIRVVLWAVFFVFYAWYRKPVGWLPFDIFITVFLSICIFALFGGRFLIMDIRELWREKKRDKSKR